MSASPNLGESGSQGLGTGAEKATHLTKRDLDRGKLAIVVGIDGAGKSTVMRRLAERGFLTSHWRRLRGVDEGWAEFVASAPRVIRTLRGPDRAQLVVKLVEGEWSNLIAPRLAAGQDVVADGLYLKPFVKELLYEECSVDDISRASPLTGLELVIMLDVPVEVAVRRRAGQPISQYECFAGPDDFADFQAKQRERLLSTIQAWNHVVVDGNRDAGDVEADVVSILEQAGFVPPRR